MKRRCKPIAWLPIDSRLFPFLSFSHIQGIPRIFLTVEMFLAVLIVLGSLVLMVFTLFG